MSTCLCIFLKAPRPGHVKTRLAATIGADRAAELYRAFLLDTLAWATRFPASDRRIEYSPRGREAAVKAIVPDRARPCSFHPQVDGDLGARLHAAFSAMFRAGHRRCVVVGTDCPTLGPHDVRLAFKALESADLVLGPTFDGGYYLVGLSRPAPQLFDNMPWSTERVYDLTVARATESGLRRRTLRTLADVDTASDLGPLYAELVSRRGSGQLPFPVQTFRLLECLLPRDHRHAPGGCGESRIAKSARPPTVDTDED